MAQLFNGWGVPTLQNGATLQKARVKEVGAPLQKGRGERSGCTLQKKKGERSHVAEGVKEVDATLQKGSR